MCVTVEWYAYVYIGCTGRPIVWFHQLQFQFLSLPPCKMEVVEMVVVCIPILVGEAETMIINIIMTVSLEELMLYMLL